MDWQKIKGKTEDHIVGLIFLLVTFLCGVVWQAVPSETWKRLEEAIPKRVLAAVSVLLLIGLSTAIAYMYSLRKQLKGTHASKNSFSDFRVISESGNSIHFEVWYFYSGALGNDGEIYIYVIPLDRDGKRSPYGAMLSGINIAVVGHRALASISYTLQVKPSDGAYTTTHIKLCMEHRQKGIFHCQTFPYRKTWIPRQPAS